MQVPLEPLLPDLGAVLETALDAVVVMREDGSVAAWNQVAEQTFGWSQEDAVGRQLSALIIPHRYRDAHYRGLERYLATGDGPVLNSHFEISALRSSGEEFPIELSITPTSSGGTRVFLGFLRDITRRKLDEATIRRRAVEAEALSRLTALAAESGSFERVMSGCLQAVCEITGWSLGHAFSYSDGEDQALADTDIWHACEPMDVGPLQEVTRAIRFAPGVGLPGRVLETQQPVWISDVERDPEFVRSRIAGSLGLHAAFAFPVLSGSRTIAVLEFFHSSPAEPDLSLWPTLHTLGQQVGRVFERTRAEAALRQEREALLAEIERREALEQQRQLLLDELNHRVKNMLAVVLGIAQQTAKTSSSVPEFTASFSGRLASLAKAHSLLTADVWESAPLDGLVRELTGTYTSEADGRVEIQGPHVLLPPRAVLALSLVVHELMTNTIKHGALSVPEGRVTISWTLEPANGAARVRLRWREQGMTGLAEPTHAGFGTRLINASVRHELGGTPEFRWLPGGLELDLDFPAVEQTGRVDQQ